MKRKDGDEKRSELNVSNMLLNFNDLNSFYKNSVKNKHPILPGRQQTETKQTA